MQIRKINDVYFPEREKIDKAQFILDRSGLVLKICKIPTASLNCKMLHFFSLSFSEAAHAENGMCQFWDRCTSERKQQMQMIAVSHASLNPEH